VITSITFEKICEPHFGVSSNLSSDAVMNLLFIQNVALKQVVQWGCGCPLPESTQGQAEWGFEQPGLEGGVPAYSRGLKRDDVLKGPFQSKPFYDSLTGLKCKKVNVIRKIIA